MLGNNHCQILRTDTFTEQARTGVQKGMQFVSVSPDGSLVATGARGATGVKVWDGRTGTLLKELSIDDKSEGTSVLFSPDGRRLVTSVPNQYHFWEVGSWNVALHIPDSGEHVPARMAFSPDGKLFAGTAAQKLIRLYDAQSGQPLADLEAPVPRLITGLAFSPDGNQLAACGTRTALLLWDLRWIRGQLANMGLDWNSVPTQQQSTAKLGSSGPR